MAVPRVVAQPGGTPLVDFAVTLPDRPPARLSLKLEGHNPFGSIKDRPAAAMLAALEAEGRLRGGTRVIESSSGNLAVALAGRCRARGIGFVAVVDPKITPENLARLKALDAEIAMVDEPDVTGGYLLTRLALVEARCAADPDLVWTDQYHNPANPAAHARSTGPELHRQMGDAQAVFCAVSTGGTYAGLSRYFADHAPHVEVVPVDVEGSLALSDAPPRSRHLPGVGASQPSSFVRAVVPEVVPEGVAVAACRWLADRTDLRVGASSGAALAGGLAVLARRPDLTHVVCLCPDFGVRYGSTVYDDAWCARHGFDHPAPAATIRPYGGAQRSTP